MRRAPLLLIASAGLWSGIAHGAGAQPPMGGFNSAYYTCDEGQAFQIAYDSKSPKGATLTTSNNNRQYRLKRTPGEGAQFSDGAVKISVSGQEAEVEGTQIKLTGCKLKNTT